MKNEFDWSDLGLGIFLALFLFNLFMGFPEPEDSQSPRYAQTSEVWDQ